ncbi:MAG: hypothetical protein M1833_004249 [Piccolia ochrophora]|nr:MAG: hypothetical protein M1833_004249 [Piccolia ochrophora]
MLDVGCNSGAVAVQLVAYFQGASLTAADIDEDLIRQAWGHLSFQWSRSKPASPLTLQTANYFPVSAVLDHGHRPQPSNRGNLDTARSMSFPDNVYFTCEDWIVSSRDPADDPYDIILALSVLKWIHLHHLDGGVRKFFRKAGACLRSGGLLIIEIQPWTSYEKAIKPKKAPALASNFEKLKLRPDDFDGLLEAEGFNRVATIDDLPRSVWLYEKIR